MHDILLISAKKIYLLTVNNLSMKTAESFTIACKQRIAYLDCFAGPVTTNLFNTGLKHL